MQPKSKSNQAFQGLGAIKDSSSSQQKQQKQRHILFRWRPNNSKRSVAAPATACTCIYDVI
jgi:hypothetical protein